MATFKTPGVFIEEIQTIAPSVAPVPTSIPGFVGYTEKAELPDGTDVSNTPVRITSMLEYEEIFGGAHVEDFEVTLNDPQNNPVITIDRTTDDAQKNYILYYQLQMFYANGGGTCYITSVGNYPDPITKTNLETGIPKMEQIDEITLVLAPESVFLTTSGQRKDVYDLLLSHCAKMEDRFAILDVVHVGANTPLQDATAFRNTDVGSENLKYGASYYPGLLTSIAYKYSGTSVTINDQRTSPVLDEDDLDEVRTADTLLYNNILTELTKQTVLLYPSASMAGIYGRVDDQRGVWKAPANVGLFSVVEPAIQIDDAEQGDLNVDSVSGKSINAIRSFQGRGNLVWGARTLAGNDNEWRYINVRRLFLFVEESVSKATQFVVFEPNTSTTWTRVQSMVSSFLTNLWRDGGLAGATPQDAFFVNVGLGSTMTSQDILEGRMIVEIGMAAVRPAEFIILRFSHKLQES
ncbi:MAG: phage tail sheath subtilisin-like domain-containing protein [Flavobacteriales bacterium]|nr:phage tail sheath subtilisin-like domain-containing protein [Flavobacteriales bacterium]